MGRKVMAIVNPVSANGTTRKAWPAIARMMEKEGIDFDWSFTPGRFAAPAMAADAVRKGYDMLVAVGGDGTVHEVLNGLFEDGRPLNPEARVGVVSRGTGSDYIRTLGIPKNEELAVKRLKGEAVRAVDIGAARFVGLDGSAGFRYFVNIADVGLGGETVQRVERTTKVFGGFVSFLYGTIATMLGYRNKRMVVTIDGGEPMEMKATTVVVANGRYFGGGMFVAPNALLDDGVFDVVILDNFGTVELITNLPKVYKGTHLTHPKIRAYRGRKVRITSPDRVYLEMDGELPGCLDAEFTVVPKGLLVKV